MSVIKKVFEHQIWHLIFLIVLILTVNFFVNSNPDYLSGSFLGFSTSFWFWFAIVIPIFHQVYVLVVWRIELFSSFFANKFGLRRAFKIYAIGFSLLFAGRLIFIIFLALSNINSLKINPNFCYLIAIVITPIVLYLSYSVKKYFTFERAFGIDHFEKNYSVPFVKKGIFKYTNNGMYIYGFMALYLPGLILMSKGALLVAFFNHIYIWVHYYFTEIPDMKKIYGKTPKARDNF